MFEALGGVFMVVPGFLKSYFVYLLALALLVALRFFTTGSSYPWDYSVLLVATFLAFGVTATVPYFRATFKLLMLHVILSFVTVGLGWNYAFGESQSVFVKLSWLFFFVTNWVGAEFAVRAPAWTPEGVTILNLQVQQVLLQVLTTALLLAVVHCSAAFAKRFISRPA